MSLFGARTLTRLIIRGNLQEFYRNSCTSSTKLPLQSRSVQPNPSHYDLFKYVLQVPRRYSTSYEPDGKTTVTILNSEFGASLMIDTYNETGFRLNNGMWVVGPIAIFPKSVLAFDVSDINDVTPEALVLFSLLEPKPDVLIIGVGDKGQQLPLESLQFLKNKKINVEILTTAHATTTFNFLSGDGRCVAALLIPPTHIVWSEKDFANSRLSRKQLHDADEEEEFKDPAEDDSKK